MSSERLASRKVLFGIALLALICAIPVLAQTIDSSQWKELKWRLVGPSRGGRALAVTGVAGNPNVYYFGAVAGGVWKTTDAGITWTPLTDSYRYSFDWRD